MDLSKFERGVFLVNVLGIVHNPETGKILIGRRENDPLVKELKWSFPGGRPAYENDLEEYLKLEIKKKTGLDVEVGSIILARIPPENKEFLLIYYRCGIIGGKEKAGEKFVELKWITPIEAQKYFTTSLHPKLLKYLKSMSK